jgi:hypothetical protein
MSNTMSIFDAFTSLVPPKCEESGFRKAVNVYGVVSESSWTAIVTAAVKEDERAGQGHTSETPLHQSAT